MHLAIIFPALDTLEIDTLVRVCLCVCLSVCSTGILIATGTEHEDDSEYSHDFSPPTSPELTRYVLSEAFRALVVSHGYRSVDSIWSSSDVEFSPNNSERRKFRTDVCLPYTPDHLNELILGPFFFTLFLLYTGRVRLIDYARHVHKRIPLVPPADTQPVWLRL